MTVPAQIPFNSYTYGGGPQTFNYNWHLIAATDMVVTINGGSAKVLNVDFTVSGVGNLAGGVMTYLSVLVNGDIIRISRNTGLFRTQDYLEGGDFLADVVDNDFDRLVMMVQDVYAQATIAAASVTIYLASAFLNLTDTFPSYSGRAGQYLRVNGAATGIESAAIAILTQFKQLSDVQDYAGNANKAVVVNSSATGLIYDGTPLGDARFKLGADQSLTGGTTATLAFSAADYNNLQRGTFDTSLGQYTSTNGGRVIIGLQVSSNLAPGALLTATIERNGTIALVKGDKQNYAGATAVQERVPLSTPVTLLAGDTVRGRVLASVNSTITSAIEETQMWIQELA